MSDSWQPDDTAPDVEATLDALGLLVVKLDAHTKILSANSARRAAGPRTSDSSIRPRTACRRQS